MTAPRETPRAQVVIGGRSVPVFDTVEQVRAKLEAAGVNGTVTFRTEPAHFAIAGVLEVPAGAVEGFH